ncbi:hypothetical protein [Aestuariivirga sp.]|uniref:hypothetical protein n=1 Tax=Aestuariivirga sp. TaxID=2650926 RepID=UPI0035940677
MKHALVASLLLAASSCAAMAEELIVPATDPSLVFTFAIGKQINVRFADSFAKGRLQQADVDDLVIYELPDGKICLYGQHKGIDPAAPELAGFARPESGDFCVPLSDVSVKVVPQSAEGAPNAPFYATDKKSCAWVWNRGKGIGLWTETCTFDTGRWDVHYDEVNDLFALRVDAGEPYPVLRQYSNAGGIEALIPDLKAKGLVLDDAECLLQPATDQLAPPGWSAWNVMPSGKRKEAFDAQLQEEVPDPPCGELGLAVDHIGYFMVSNDNAERVVHVNLGQDGTMIDLGSITLVK